MAEVEKRSTPLAEDTRTRLYWVYRSQIEHEDELIGLRVGWFIAGEALLFAAYGVVLAVQTKQPIKGTLSIDGRLLSIVPIVGMTMAAVVGVGIGAAMHQIVRLYLEHERLYPLGQRPVGYPPLRASNAIATLGHLPASVLAPMIILSWAFVWKGWSGFFWALGVVGFLAGVFIVMHENWESSMHENWVSKFKREMGFDSAS